MTRQMSKRDAYAKNLPIRWKDLADGTIAQTISAQNAGAKFREAFEAYTPNTGGKWLQTVGSGDIVQLDGNAVASSYLVISKDPLSADTETVVESVANFQMPFELAVGLHASQRTLGQELAVEVVSTEDPLPAIPDVAISTMSQSTTTLSITTAAPHGLVPGMRFGVKNCLDSRMNYAALVVATVPTPTTLTATAGPNGTIPSLTVGPFTSGTVYARTSMGRAPNGTSMILEQVNVTQASFYVRSESGDALPSGTANGNHSATINTTASVSALGAAGAYAFQPATEYRLVPMVDAIQWYDTAVDNAGQGTNRHKRTQVVPNAIKDYKVRFRAKNLGGLTRPVAQIVSAAKTGTTTATIVTDVPHGLTVNDIIHVAGIRDTTNFPNTASLAVASVVDATTFTTVIGGAVTATSYGGFVARQNGGQSQQGLIGQTIQTVQRTSNVVTLTLNTTLTGLTIGDYVNIVGVRDNATGASLGLDGPYRVRDAFSTTIVLEPIGTGPTGIDIGATNCGGAVLKRTDLRISFVRVLEFDRLRIEAAPRPAGDASTALPVAINTTVTVSQATASSLNVQAVGSAAEDAAASANPVITGGVVRTAAAPATLVAGDAARLTLTAAGALAVCFGAPVSGAEVASAARTTSGNSGTISVPTGGALSGLIVVSAQSGTTPTLDITLEESFDNGTTWHQVWAAPRFAGATGNVVIPAMLICGLRRWVWTIGGTTPSFTFAINTNQLSIPAPIMRKMFDRTANVLNGTVSTPTASLLITGCKIVTAKVLIGAATTPATYQIQVSDDNVNWVNVGAATPAVANSMVTFSVADLAADWARVIVTSGATGQTGTYVALQANG